jgi:flagellar protein FliT
MLPMPVQIDLYEQMSALSAQMVEAAQANDWGGLIVLEKSVSALRDILLAEDDNGPPAAGEVDLKRVLIQRILDDDAEIRRHTEPWMEHLCLFLGGPAKRRQLERACGSADCR